MGTASLEKSKKIDLIVSSISILLGWLIVVPISILIPKKKGLIITVGRDAKHYADNTKYFNNHLISVNYKHSYFLFEKKNTSYKKVPNAIYYPSFKAIWLLLRCEFIVIDTTTWYKNLKYHLAVKSKKIQLWHGLGIKKVEMGTDIFTKSKLRHLRIIYGILRGQLNKYFFISSTSDYYTKNLYSKSFRYKAILNLGQPRNDVLFRNPTLYDLINSDEATLKALNDYKNKGYKIAIYTPTFRKKLKLDVFDFKKLNEFAIKENIIFVFKYHILEPEPEINNYSNILLYKKAFDVYPLFQISDILITDYSSIYVDYIIQDKPIIFYIPDYTEYNEYDSPLRSDFHDITPGIKSKNQNDFESHILSELNNPKTEFKIRRQEILKLSYLHPDGNSSERILQEIIK